MKQADVSGVAAVFGEVAAAFGALDLPRFRACYRLPSIVISSSQVLVLESDIAFDGFFSSMMKGLQARGFGSSEILRANYAFQAETIAIASIQWLRRRIDGSELERLGATYSLVATNAGWKIVALTAHSPEGVLEFASAGNESYAPD